MTERNPDCTPEEPGIYNHLDLVLAVMDGCPNYGAEIVKGSKVISNGEMPKTDSLQKEPDSRSIST